MPKRLLAFLVPAALTGWFLRGRLAIAVTKKALPKRISADPAGALPDGLHIAICGSGSPIPDEQRGNPCVAVIAGDAIYVVDAGEKASETFNRMQLRPDRIEAVLLTHFHSDHIGGLGSMALQRWVANAASTKLRVLGPTGVDRVVDGYNEAYALDSSYRTAHHGEAIAPSSSAGMTAEPFEFAAGEKSCVVLEEGGLTVTAFEVDHSPATPAVGYRFDYKGRSIVVSGDTVYSDSLVEASTGADLLVHDALSADLLKLVEDASRDAGFLNRAQILVDVTDYHATPAQAADAARNAKVGALALTHVIPPLPIKALEGPYLGDAKERFTGPLWIANDGDLYSLVVGGREVDRTTLFSRGPIG
ncbi:MAG: MBL fold metallo-hydrolase [Actinobacteria bacterium]|uniref:Unannotated protein n=1 Tax=freshwater metagenome TaxID=449393 RepID=A0A6J5ZPI1_9ZZZZ|nr:MBL fold metallo-hydrolase [Actinomycetota bacterium]